MCSGNPFFVKKRLQWGHCESFGELFFAICLLCQICGPTFSRSRPLGRNLLACRPRLRFPLLL